jgi:alkanesulfonate monooxygenase SsuD/methylene tetrahydromethanopterin reductase-like flavin-dependent oxidoreductase (luciferase family)
MEHHGINPGERRDVVRERVLAMKGLWIDEVASFRGDYVRIEPSWAWPKPVQRPHPPILIGGAAGPTLFRHIAEFADGWLPIGGAGVKQALPDLHRAAEAAGRDPASISVVPFGSFPTPAKLEYFASIGIAEVVCRLPSAPESGVLPELNRLAGLL